MLFSDMTVQMKPGLIDNTVIYPITPVRLLFICRYVVLLMLSNKERVSCTLKYSMFPSICCMLSGSFAVARQGFCTILIVSATDKMLSEPIPNIVPSSQETEVMLEWRCFQN